MARIANMASAADLAAWKGKTGRKRHAVDGFESDLERQYSIRLEMLKTAGLIRLWQYEPERLHIGLRCSYKPDFRVVNAAGRVEFHEVKGYMREAARVRLHVAAERYPDAEFFLVKRKAGQWVIRNVREKR